MKLSKKTLNVILWSLGFMTLFTYAMLFTVFISKLDTKIVKSTVLNNIPKAFVVTSGSMEPSIKTGSLVITKPQTIYSQGDIVTFSTDADKKSFITHRIDTKTFPDGVAYQAAYTTKGDANKVVDNQTVINENISGKVIFSVPFLGYFANFAKTPKGFILLVVIPATIIVYEELKNLKKEFSKFFKKTVHKNNYISQRKYVFIPIIGAFLVIAALSGSYFSNREKSDLNSFTAANSYSQTVILENKNSDWAIIEDNTFGNLIYEPEGPTFKFDFKGQGLSPNKSFCLIYYADPYPGNNPGAFLGNGTTDSLGNVGISGDVDLGFDIPHSDDGNFPNGGKIWLVTCGSYNQSTKSVTNWNFNDWLLETGLIKYKRISPTPSPNPLTTIYLNQLGGDITNQYGYNIDYTHASSQNVYFTYQTPSVDKLIGTIHGTNLKPFATYQVKLSGIPTCVDPVNGKDNANEYIGYKGRWTCVSSNCSAQSALQRNRSDSQYNANKLKADNDPTKECIVSYLVFDYFNADSNGNTAKSIQSLNSYHVLWCGGGVCNNNTNSNLSYLDPTHPSVNFCPEDKVNGEIERGSCGSLVLDPGSYHLQMSLTEESFHQGNWATVLSGNIDFEINN